MKKNLTKLAVAAILALAAAPGRAASKTINVTVAPTAASSLSISPTPADASFGNVPVNVSDNLLPQGFIVTNTGSLAVTLGLRVNPSDAVWAASDGIGPDTYRILAIANSGQPDPTSFTRPADVVLPSFKGCGVFFQGDQSCSNIPPGESRTFWLLFDSPTSSSVAGERSFGIEINAL